MADLPRFDLSVIDRNNKRPERPNQEQAQRFEPAFSQIGLGNGEMDRLVAQVDSIQSPLGQAIVRGMFRRKLGIDLPTATEIENQKMLAYQRQIGLRKTMAKDMVDMAYATILRFERDIANGRVENQYGSFELPEVLARGIKVDANILERPEEFWDLTNILAEKGVFPIEIPQGIDKGLMHLAGMGVPTVAEQQQAESEQTVKGMETTVAGAEAAGKLLKLQEEFRGGKGVSYELAKNAILRRGKAAGVNLGTGWFSDIDTPKGAVAMYKGIQDAFEIMRSTGTSAKDAVVMLAESPIGRNIKDQLEELPVSEQGVEVGETYDVAKQASFFLLGSMMKLAEVSGMDVQEVVRSFGLPGMDPNSFFSAAQENAIQLDMTLREYLDEMGLNLRAPGQTTRGE